MKHFPNLLLASDWPQLNLGICENSMTWKETSSPKFSNSRITSISQKECAGDLLEQG